jgi:hypothetical protein
VPTQASSRGMYSIRGGGTRQPRYENDFYAWVQRALAARERFPDHQGVTLLITF